MKPSVGSMLHPIADEFISNQQRIFPYSFRINFLPFVRGGFRWGRILSMKFKMSVCMLRNVDCGLMFLPPLNPSLQRRGEIVTRDFTRLKENVKLEVSL